MLISVHIGAHCTNGHRLVHTLLKNRDALAAQRVLVPGPATYRTLLPDAMHKLRQTKASAETQDVVLDAITDGVTADRVVLSYEDVICLPAFILEGGRLYAKAHYKLPWLRNVFPDHKMEFHFSVRNPATLLPEAYALCAHKRSYDDFVGATDLRSLRWSETLRIMREHCPDAPITVWAYEDTPLIWSQVLHEVAGVPREVEMAGELDIIAEIMKREGMKRLRAYLVTHKPTSELQYQRILAAFLDKYVEEDAIAQDIDLPGWDQELVDALTATYEDDLDTISQIEGVRLIAP